MSVCGGGRGWTYIGTLVISHPQIKIWKQTLVKHVKVLAKLGLSLTQSEVKSLMILQDLVSFIFKDFTLFIR